MPPRWILVLSPDAARLVRIVNACAADGIKNIMTVHDYFCFLAPQGKDALIQEFWQMD
jgi:hypothetical protein